MKPKSLLLTIFIMLSFLKPSELAAQVIESCAQSRLQSAARMALASPQHVKLMNQYDMSFYGLDLQLERNSIFISGTVTLKAELKEAKLDTFAFELHPNFTIESVIINDVLQPAVIRNGSDVAVRLTTPVQTPNMVTAVITYSGSAPQQASAALGNGFSSATEPTWGNQVTWSLSEPYAALEWWPTKQVLTDKADSVHVFVTTSADNKVGSNGILTQVIDLPNGKKRHEWNSSYPIAYYLVSVAVSNYEEYLIYANPAGATAPVPILNYVYRNGALERYKSEIDLTAPLLEYYSSAFTLYPFAKEKYGHSMAPMGGGMEHQTMTTQSTFTFTLTAHELAHQWFGDNVTCTSWEDIWLNEGFASYAEFLALQQLRPESAAAWMENTHAIALQSPNGSVRVADTTDVRRIFDYSLTYKKGASVVHMLRFQVNNDALFFQTLQNYQQQFSDSTASTSDLKRLFEETTGTNLDLFFEQWYAGTGFPVFQIEWNKTGSTLTLQSNQTGSGNTSFFKTDVEYLIRTATRDQIVRVSQDQPQQTYTFEVEGDIESIIVDPNNWLLKEVTSVERNTLLAIENEPKQQPILYPNPVTKAAIRIVNLPFAATEATIYDQIGRRVWQGKLLREKNVWLPTQNLPAGLYHIHLTNGTESYHSKFIKLD